MGNFFFAECMQPKNKRQTRPAKLPRQTAGHRVMDQGEFPLANLFHGPIFATRFAWFSVASAVFVESVQNMSSAACHAHQPPKTTKAARTKPACSKFQKAVETRPYIYSRVVSFFFGGGDSYENVTYLLNGCMDSACFQKGSTKLKKTYSKDFGPCPFPFLFWPGDSRQHSQNSACQQYPLA